MGTEYLTLDVAKKIAVAAQEKATEIGVKVSISILDNHGNMKYFQRMDDANYGSIRISRLKANTSASMMVPSSVMCDRSAAMPCNPFAEIPGIVLLHGGLPINSSDGRHIGAIGVSGATSEQDVQCAQAGIDSVHGLI